MLYYYKWFCNRMEFKTEWTLNAQTTQTRARYRRGGYREYFEPNFKQTTQQSPHNISDMAVIDASIIVRCFNEEEFIGKLLFGLSRQEGPHRHETIVVDSGSTDQTLEIAKKFTNRIIEIPPESFSFGRALNIGCEAARGKYLLIISAHALPVYQDWITSMISSFQNDKIAMVYGKQRGIPSSAFSEQQIFEKQYPETSVPLQDHPFCNNANAAVRSQIWKEIRYDESLTGLEDLAFAKECMSSGYRISYSARAEIYHVHRETPSQIENRYRREAIAYKKIFPDEEMTFGDFMKLLIQNIGSDFFHAYNKGMFRKNLLGILSFRFRQFFGTYLGYCQRGDVSETLKRTFYYPNRLSRTAYHSEDTREPIDYHLKDLER